METRTRRHSRQRLRQDPGGQPSGAVAPLSTSSCSELASKLRRPRRVTSVATRRTGRCATRLRLSEYRATKVASASSRSNDEGVEERVEDGAGCAGPSPVKATVLASSQRPSETPMSSACRPVSTLRARRDPQLREAEHGALATPSAQASVRRRRKRTATRRISLTTGRGTGRSGAAPHVAMVSGQPGWSRPRSHSKCTATTAKTVSARATISRRRAEVWSWRRVPLASSRSNRPSTLCTEGPWS
mmetsp:Transcript_14931/g.30683  ORF Transcript_14931/g.30683 Transcript_14931/m.30683 type:complete len:245 (+) Transcript_14931:3378-4112(+)